MSDDFARMLRGLMENRGLTPRAISRASARADSTINQLLSGKISPRSEILKDIAPVLQMDASDLFVIAGLPVDPALRREPLAAPEIGELVAVASFLEVEQIRIIIETAKRIRGGGRE